MLSVSTGAIIWTAAIGIFTYVLLNLFRAALIGLKRRQALAKLPGVPPRSFLFGHIVDLLGDVGEKGLETIREGIKMYPRLSKIAYGPQMVCSIHDPVLAKPIFKSSEPKPRDFGGYKFVFPWLGDGLLLAGGAKWARNRRLLTPAFHFDILKPYMDVNNKAVDILFTKLEKFAADGTPFEAFQHVSMLTLDIILKCAFSYDTGCQVMGDTHPYVKAVTQIGQSSSDRLLQPWLYPNFVFFYLSEQGRQCRKHIDYVHSVSEDVIKRRKATLDKEGKVLLKDRKYLDFLDILLTAKDENGKGLSDKDIRNEVDTFLFEGHDTTASGISWMLYSMAEHQEHQEKCQEEVDAILDSRDSDYINWDDLNRMPYLTMCLKEALRLHTPVPFIERITTKDVFIDGFHIPAGTMVDLQLYIMAHNQYVWEDPMKYDPDRFLPERIKEMDSFSFVPFSAGPRNCIGQSFAMHEMKVAVARILRRYTLKTVPDRPAKHQIQVVMKTEDGMYMTAEKRSTQDAECESVNNGKANGFSNGVH